MSGNFKQQFSIKIMSAASKLARATEEKINKFSEQFQNKSETCVLLVKEAEKNTYLAEEIESKYSSEDNHRNLNMH